MQEHMNVRCGSHATEVAGHLRLLYCCVMLCISTSNWANNKNKTSLQNNTNTCWWWKHLEITGTFWNVCARIKGSLRCVSASRPVTRKRLSVHSRAAAETQTGSEPRCSFFCLCTVSALRAFVLPSVLQLASCIYQLLTKLHYHYPLWGAGSAHLTDVPQTNIQQLLVQIYPIKKKEQRQGRFTVNILVY